MIRAICIAVAGLSLVLATLLGSTLLAEHFYGRAVAHCQEFGGVPVAVENRIAYDCLTPYGRIRP